MENVILLRHGELHLKGKNIKFFQRRLVSNLKDALADFECKLLVLQNRYVVCDFADTDCAKITARLQQVFGLISLSKAYKVESDLDKIFEAAKLCLRNGESFRVTTNRADKTFALNSMEVSKELGYRLLTHYTDCTVDLHNPQTVVNVDIRENGESFVFARSLPAAGGLPVGTSGNAIALLSGGIDSPVAAYMMAKRGVKLTCLHFFSYPYTSLAAKKKVVDLAQKISPYLSGLDLYMISFTKIQEEIHKHCNSNYMITIMRRLMMRLAEMLAQKTDCNFIITGESLGQVASQTIESLTSTQDATSLPILRPLIGFDKVEIVDIAQKIQTYDLSILPYEDCCTVFLPDHPIIHPKLDNVHKEESKLQDIQELLLDALNNIELIKIK